MFAVVPKAKSDFVSYIVSEVKRRLQNELKVGSSVAGANRNDLKIKFSRHIYATFTCKSCLKTWASSKATCEIDYSISRRSYGSPHVLYYVQVFRQKCLQCEIYGNATAEPSDMDYIVDEFVQKVNRILTNAPRTEKKGKKTEALLQGHKSQLCQACSLGKCSQNNEGETKSKGVDYLSRLFSGLSLE